ncbi:nuclear protein localization protein 4 homolog [Gigantopelta aegis]|uniref:nuclear protein localization protein 4 homolog n=1 Tax=Gigantopelta aegis TaxID=1735272 RepID=UPI001B88CF28|nr:nuclear protein localization protein 4 homolog [Gigantopelta aegis]
MSKVITVRVQSAEHGTKRIETKGSESIANFFNKIQSEFGLGDIGWDVYQKRDKTGHIRTSRAKNIDSYKIKHGDMLYLVCSAKTGGNEEPMETGSTSSNMPSSGIQQDEVDLILGKEDGRIHRNRNDQLCHHGPNGKCLHCVPLEPYDEDFLKSCEPPIKFLSFHSYLRKLTGGVDRGKFVNLENLSCRIKTGCKEHPPWPGGICTKCQPNAVTLNRQKYRHIDNIMFENPQVADRFLDFWRKTGSQRIGILYGRYEPHKDVPLGIKATVAAIYEPPQVCTKNRIELLEDEKENVVNQVAEKLGVRPVGWIFTDLVADDLTKGTVKNFRGNMDAHFISSEECIMAGHFQNKYKNPCKLSREGYFGSKFVTIVVTGDNSNQIHFEGYQVTNQCMALVNDECLIPTKDVPELGYIKESSNEQYVPDVFYKNKDNYGNEVTQLARPLPVEYLLVDIPAAFPVEPQYTFQTNPDVKPFPTENRSDLGEIQDFNSLVQYMGSFQPSQFLECMSDFHLLLFLATSEMLPLKTKMNILLEAVKTKSESKAMEFKKSEEFATVEEMIAAHAPSPTISRQASYVGPGAAPLPPIGQSGSLWTCAHCTFLNQPGHNTCDICSLPR